MPNQTVAARTALSEESDRLQAFGNAYDYNVGYLTELLNSSHAAFAAFSKARQLSSYRSQLPLDAHFVARISTMQAEDCGACAQLNLRMAVEAGVDRDLLSQLLREPERLAPALADVYQHASSVARGELVDAKRVERLRKHYGATGLAELALCITGSRIFPTLKRALGTPPNCEVLHLEF